MLHSPRNLLVWEDALRCILLREALQLRGQPRLAAAGKVQRPAQRLDMQHADIMPVFCAAKARTSSKMCLRKCDRSPTSTSWKARKLELFRNQVMHTLRFLAASLSRPSDARGCSS